MAQVLSEYALANKKKYNNEYAKNFFKSKLIQFNVQYPDQMEMLEWINAQPEGGNEYIRRLVRADMEARKSK